MRPHAITTLILAPVILAAVALTGCRNPDAPAATVTAAVTTAAAAPGSPGEPTAPPAPSATSQAPARVGQTPQGALGAFALLYINWSYETLTAEQRTLAGMAVGQARLAEQQAAATSVSDSTIRRGHIYNSGQVVSVAPDAAQPRTWAIVTRERTGGNTQYEGLPASYHVTLARLAPVPGGYAVSEWLPQS
jgi:hypothetical protein